MPEHPALTHVCMWTPDGWQHVTAEESDGKNGLYMCELCGQAVMLASGSVYTPHFRHWPKDYKYCPERRKSDSPESQQIHSPKDTQLPIRVVFRRNEFGFELGMPNVTRCVLDRNSSGDFVITAVAESRVLQKFTYSVSCLNEDSTTFCDVGDYPSESYAVEAPEGFPSSWLKTTEGINPDKGGLFSFRTHRHIRPASHVNAGEVYYLLTHEEFSDDVHMGVEIKHVAEHKDFRIYEVIARNLSRDSAEFFMNYRYRLTEGMCVVWPEHIESNGRVMHNRDYSIIHVNGAYGISLRVNPESSIDVETYFRNGSPAGRVAKLPANNEHIDLSTKNASVSIEHCEVNQVRRICAVDVKDGKDTSIASGEYSKLPEGGFLMILAQFYGSVISRKGGEIFRRQEISAGEYCRVSDVEFDTEIEIFQGLDKVFQASFIRETQVIPSGSDSALLERLCRFGGDVVPVRSIAGLCERLRGFPEVSKWLYRSARRGMISEQAAKFLRNYINNMEG